jgi:hypothetical protein
MTTDGKPVIVTSIDVSPTALALVALLRRLPAAKANKDAA